MKAIGDAGRGLQSVLEVEWADCERRHGLPHGRRQFQVWTGSQREFQDVFYDEFGVVVELDGKVGHSSTGGQLRDMRRDNRNTVTGLPTLRFGYVDVTSNGCAAAAQVAELLHRLGWLGKLQPCPQCVNREPRQNTSSGSRKVVR